MQTDLAETEVIILADESANWRIAGLRQIDRLVLAVEEFASRSSARVINATVVWNDIVPPGERKLPARRSSSAVIWHELTSEPKRDRALVLTTRVVLARHSLDGFDPANADRMDARVLANAADIPAAEKWLARSLGKPQDGWVSRYFNRHISTAITRWLLRKDVRPVHATVGAFVFALLGCAALVRGGYGSVLLGTFLFLCFSVLDGCDGEIARAKYLDSRAGSRLDFIFDTGANVLFVVSLGAGLAGTFGRVHLLIEGIATGVLIVINELMLTRGGNGGVETKTPHSGIYSRHARMLSDAGAFAFGESAVRLIVQLTKRDVAWLAFVVFAAFGIAPWILHLSGVAAAVTCGLSLLAIIRRSPARQT